MHKNNSKQFKSKHLDDVVKDFPSSVIIGFFSIMPKKVLQYLLKIFNSRK